MRAAAADGDYYESVVSPYLSIGGYSFAIDANSDEDAIADLGSALCVEMGRTISKKLQLDESAMIWQGKAAAGFSGQVILKKSGHGVVAKLVPENLSQIVSIPCKYLR